MVGGSAGRRPSVGGQQAIGVAIPDVAGIVIAQNSAILDGLVDKPKRQIGFDQTVERLGCVCEVVW